jgi:hypothetical protein
MPWRASELFYEGVGVVHSASVIVSMPLVAGGSFHHHRRGQGPGRVPVSMSLVAGELFRWTLFDAQYPEFWFLCP